MKPYKIVLTIILSLICILPTQAKEKKRYEHRLMAGYNLGASAPIPLPRTVRSVSAYWPVFTPQLGYNFTYNYTDKWSISTGLTLENKGMGVRDKVKYMYTNVIMDGAEMKGYFVGRNETKVKISYFTVPIIFAYEVSENWKISGGGYVSYRTSSEFSGTVWDGYIRETPNDEDITGSDKKIIKNKNDATFDFGKDMRNFDFGLQVGMEHQFNYRFGMYANMTYGLTSIFPSSFKGIDMKMHNIYLAVGMSYRLK